MGENEKRGNIWNLLVFVGINRKGDLGFWDRG